MSYYCKECCNTFPEKPSKHGFIHLKKSYPDYKLRWRFEKCNGVVGKVKE